MSEVSAREPCALASRRLEIACVCVCVCALLRAEKLTGGRVSARGTWCAVRARVVVVVQGLWRAGRLVAGLVRLRESVLRRVCALVMLRRLVLRMRVVLLVNNA